MIRVAVVFAGFMGAAGVSLAAAAAHGGDPGRLGPASSMLLFHAPAIIAGAALIERRLLHVLTATIAIAAMIVGAALFAGDLAVRHFFGQALFPMAAPSGGLLLIVSWLALAAAALLPRRP